MSEGSNEALNKFIEELEEDNKRYAEREERIKEFFDNLFNKTKKKINNYVKDVKNNFNKRDYDFLELNKKIYMNEDGSMNELSLSLFLKSTITLFGLVPLGFEIGKYPVLLILANFETICNNVQEK